MDDQHDTVTMPRLELERMTAEAFRMKFANERLVEALQLSVATIERISVRHNIHGSAQGTLDVAAAALKGAA